MSEQKTNNSRRSFLRSMAVASAAPAVVTTRLAAGVQELGRTVEPIQPAGPNDRIRIATIGMGIIGFIDTDTALKVPGVELVPLAGAREVVGFNRLVEGHLDEPAVRSAAAAAAATFQRA